MTRRKMREKDRREEFLDAARELFIVNGYRGTSMQQIAGHAGYSKRTVYLDYLNKDELFTSVCAEGGELLLTKLEQMPCDDLSIEDAISRVLEVYLEFSRDHSEYFRMIFSDATPDIIANCTPELRERVAELERSCLKVLVDLAERAVQENIIPLIDPWEVAGMFVGAATGVILLSMIGSQTVFSRETLESLMKRATRTLWRGLRIVDESPGVK